VGNIAFTIKLSTIYSKYRIALSDIVSNPGEGKRVGMVIDSVLLARPKSGSQR